MTATTGRPGTGAAAAPTGRAGGAGRARIVLVVVAGLVVALVVLALVAPSRRNDGPPLDTSSTSAQGTRAAVELARRLGAEVDVTSQLPGPDTDVALMFEDLVGPDDETDLVDWVAAGHTLVVADPYSASTPPAELSSVDVLAESLEVRRGRCDVVDPAGIDVLGSLASFGPVARFEVPSGARSCFGDDTGAVVVVEPVGAGRIVSVGTPWVFTNEALDQADNAGLFAALAVPSEGTRLDVLVPGDDDSGLRPPDDSGSLGLPTGVALGLVQLLVAFVVYALYRARRLGAPVHEDPPVAIAGSELTRAVGGLLEHAGARDRAAASLRHAARRRLAAALGLPVGAAPTAVVATVAARTTIRRERLEAALLDAPVRDDQALAALGRELDALVEEALGPSPAPGSGSGSGRRDLDPSPPSPSSPSPGGPS